MAEETSAAAPMVIDAVVKDDVTPESLEDALRIVLLKAREANGLIRGLSEVARALDRRTAHLCVLADDCEDEEYKKLITALSKQSAIDIINVESREKLAEWAGLQRQKSDGSVKTHKCSCVAISDYGERTRALDFLQEQMK